MSRVILFIILLVCRTSVACDLTVRWSEDEPYSYLGEASELKGLYVEIAQIVFDEIGCKVQFLDMPWARGLAELNKGSLDVLPGTLKTAERESFAYFSDPVNRSPNIMFVRKDNTAAFAFTRLEQIRDLDFQLGIQIGSFNGEAFRQLFGRAEFEKRIKYFSYRTGAWEMLARGRVDGLIADEVTGLVELRNLGLLEQIGATSVIVSGEDAFFAFSRQSVAISVVDNFNKTLAKLQSDGRYQTILAKNLPCEVSLKSLGCRHDTQQL